jgi:hypothetical protein
MLDRQVDQFAHLKAASKCLHEVARLGAENSLVCIVFACLAARGLLDLDVRECRVVEEPGKICQHSLRLLLLEFSVAYVFRLAFCVFAILAVLVVSVVDKAGRLTRYQHM